MSAATVRAVKWIFHVTIGRRLMAAAAVVVCRLVNAAGPVALPTNEPICGFLEKPSYVAALSIKQGLSVEMFAGDAPAGQPVTLRFFVNQKPRGLPVDELQVEHEKMIHIIGVREDLGEFFHLHPARVSPGTWAVTHTFSRGGNYRIWADVKFRGRSYSFAEPVLKVSGDAGESASTRKLERASPYRLAFSPPKPLSTGTNRLEFSIHDAAGGPVETENFLGAAMHLVIVKDDLSVFLHAHPENHTTAATLVAFQQIFPQPGNYTLFVQYRPGPAKLPVDEALLEEFQVDVGGTK